MQRERRGEDAAAEAPQAFKEGASLLWNAQNRIHISCSAATWEVRGGDRLSLWGVIKKGLPILGYPSLVHLEGSVAPQLFLSSCEVLFYLLSKQIDECQHTDCGTDWEPKQLQNSVNHSQGSPPRFSLNQPDTSYY